VSVHLTEEEQIETMKRWWKDNGKTILGIVIVCVIGYFASTAWKEKQLAKAEDASVRYESLLKLVNVEAGKAMSDTDKTTAKHLASELKEKNANTLYAASAAFFLAKLAVDAGDLDAAIKELQWVVASKADVPTTQLARVRLAKVLLAKEAYAEASAQVAEEPSKAFSSEYAEVRGDILRAQGSKAAALTAYEKAVADTDPQQQERLMVLNMKVDDLKLPAAPMEEEKGQEEKGQEKKAQEEKAQ
jgi:predicted negative regulator of RcsB-dependent stress response